MNLLQRWTRGETWQELRRRMIAETSAFIARGLRHPEEAVRIPTIPAGSGRFPPSLSSAFWDRVLNDES